MKPLNTFFIFALFTYFVFSQNQVEQDTLKASQYFKKAESLLETRKLDSSLVYFQKALPIYQNAKVWEKVARCYNKISENMWRNRKFKVSMNNAKEALKIHAIYIKEPNREEAHAYDNLGNYFENISDFDKALEYYQKALEIRKNIFDKDLNTSYVYF